MTINNLCKVFIGSLLISMLLGGVSRIAEHKFEEMTEKEQEQIILIAEEIPQPHEENEDTIIAFNELEDGEFIKA